MIEESMAIFINLISSFLYDFIKSLLEKKYYKGSIPANIHFST